jgi:hypothetical protein
MVWKRVIKAKKKKKLYILAFATPNAISWRKEEE